MTAPLRRHADPLARKLVPVVREMLLAEVERVAVSLARPKSSKADEDIMEACRQASAADRLAQAKYGVGEITARKSLERAATALGRAMRKHGRMP